jgi:hypothetical protein
LVAENWSVPGHRTTGDKPESSPTSPEQLFV